MRVSACSFINKAVSLGYPFRESIRSALELVDEYVIAVGPHPDGTREAIEQIDDPRIRIIDTTWAPDGPKGFVYSQQTMIALYNCTGDWALSLQADEAIHERDCPYLRDLIDQAHRSNRIDGIALRYRHFYGNPSTIAIGPKWYRAEARLVRMAGRRVSVPSDAQYLANIRGRKRLRYLRAPLSDAHIYHYGWVRSRDAHLNKATWTPQYWQNDSGPTDPYEQVDAKALAPFQGDHPKAMQPWLTDSANLEFQPDPTYTLTRRDKKQRVKQAIERFLPIDLSCTHFQSTRLP